MGCGDSTAQGCCGVTQAHRDVQRFHGGQRAILRRLQGHRQLQDGLDDVWLNSELLHSPKGFGNLNQPCQAWQGAGSPPEQLYHLQCFPLARAALGSSGLSQC